MSVPASAEQLAVVVVMDGMLDYGGMHGQATAIAVEQARRGHRVAFLSRWPLDGRSERIAALRRANVDILTPKWEDGPFRRVRPCEYNVRRLVRGVSLAAGSGRLPGSRLFASDRALVARDRDVNRIAVRLLRGWIARRGSQLPLVIHVVARPSAAIVSELRVFDAPVVFSEFGQLEVVGLSAETAERLGVEAYTADSPGAVRAIERIEQTPASFIPCIAGFSDPAATLPDHASQFVVVNRLSDYKQTDVAVRAAARGGFRIEIVGGGQEEDALRQLIEELGVASHVRLAGMATRDGVRHALEAAHGLILCSRLDGGPMVVLEAMSRGLPIVSTRLDGVLELVSDGEEGLYFDGTAEALAATLARLVEEPGLAARLGRAARDRWDREFSPPRLAAAYERIYRDALTRRGAAAALEGVGA